MTSPSTINAEGLALIKAFESLRLDAYSDAKGVWTIGYGHTATAREGLAISELRADKLLAVDVAKVSEGVAALAREAGVQLNDNEFSALVSFAFNVGLGALSKSTAWKRLKEDRREEAAEALLMWDAADLDHDGKIEPDEHLKGLARRRKAERALFLGQEWREEGGARP